MQSVLTETLRTHLEMATIALAITDKLDNARDSTTLVTATLKAIAHKLGVDNILYEGRSVSLNAGEIFVVHEGKTLAHFTIAKSGELTTFPWKISKAA